MDQISRSWAREPDNWSAEAAKANAEVALDWSYQFFPFDRHTVSFNISVADTHLFGCEQIVMLLRNDAGEGLENLLPLDGSWLPGSPQDGGELISFTEGESKCDIHILVRRNFVVFFVKNINCYHKWYIFSKKHTGCGIF